MQTRVFFVVGKGMIFRLRFGRFLRKQLVGKVGVGLRREALGIDHCEPNVDILRINIENSLVQHLALGRLIELGFASGGGHGDPLGVRAGQMDLIVLSPFAVLSYVLILRYSEGDLPVCFRNSSKNR